MKLWIDDVRPSPYRFSEYVLCRSVNDAIKTIECFEEGIYSDKLEFIDIDYDAGIYSYDGGDYIKLLNWLEETGRNYPIHIHSGSMSPVAVENMRAIIRRNGWEEIV